MYSKNHNESNTVFSLYFNGEREDKIMGSFKLYSRCEEPLIFCKSLLSSVSFNRNMMKVQYFFYVLGIMLLFAMKKKWFMIMYLISICVYIFTIGFVIDVFDLSKDQILLILAFSSGVMIAAGVYLSKEHKKSVAAKTKKMNMKVILGVVLPLLIIVGVIIFSVWNLRVSHTLNTELITETVAAGTCPYVCAADACLFEDGVQVAALNSGINEEAMAAIDGISLGHDDQKFDNLLFFVDGIVYVDEQ